MSHAITALLLIRLNAHPGRLLTVEALAQQLAVPARDVVDHLEALWDAGMVLTQRQWPGDVITGAMALPCAGMPCA